MSEELGPPISRLERFIKGIIESSQVVMHSVGSRRAVAEYEKALAQEMRRRGLKYAQQYPVGIPFYGPQDRGFRADFIVEGWVLLELQAVTHLTPELEDLALNYLRESGCKVCLLINFGGRGPEIRKLLPSGEVTHA